MAGTRVQPESSIADQFGMFPTAAPEFDQETDTRQSPRAVMVCQDNMEFMRGLPNGSIKLILTSPPYNVGKLYEERSTLASYVNGQAQVIAECVRLLHPRGSFCWQVGNYLDDGEVVPLDVVLYPIFKAHGLKLRNRIVWHFEHGLHCTKRLSGRYETISWFTKGPDYTCNLDPTRVPSKYPGKRHFKGPNIGRFSGNPKGKNPSDVWIFPNVKSNHVEKTIHPCQFPVELVERLVLSMTEPGDAVFDPFMGVGTSVVSALMHERIGTDATLRASMSTLPGKESALYNPEPSGPVPWESRSTIR